MGSTLSRRHVLAGGAGCALTICGLAGCASYGPEPEPTTGAPTGLTTPADAIPVGGGTVFADHQIVVTQPSSGEFKAFTAICTHQGCTVAEVTTTIDCHCHGSRYAIADGSVVAGPATAPLRELSATVSGSDITVA